MNENKSMYRVALTTPDADRFEDQSFWGEIVEADSRAVAERMARELCADRTGLGVGELVVFAVSVDASDGADAPVTDSNANDDADRAAMINRMYGDRVRAPAGAYDPGEDAFVVDESWRKTRSGHSVYDDGERVFMTGVGKKGRWAFIKRDGRIFWLNGDKLRGLSNMDVRRRLYNAAAWLGEANRWNTVAKKDDG